MEQGDLARGDAAVAPAQRGEAPTLLSSLVLDPLGQYGRSAVFSDPVLDQLAHDPAWSPTEGSELRAADGRSATWRPAKLAADGALEGGARGNSWWFQRWTHERDEVLLLEAPGAGVIYAGGEPRMGDLYALGIVRVPIALRKGANEVLIRTGRGQPRVTWSRPPAPVFLAEFDRTLPDAIEGESDRLLAAVVVVNATSEPLHGLRIEAALGRGARSSTLLPALLPLEVRKVPVALAPPEQLESDSIRAEVVLCAADGVRLHSDSLELAVRKPMQHHARTFVSRIDHSVQYYAVVPAAPRATADPAPASAGSSSAAPVAPVDDTNLPALILSLHGASVEARSQAAAYAPKDWAWVIAPTNRRPFGFDWEDWGRRDAIEVLELALRGEAARDVSGSKLNFDPARVYLTGHSMGGHGTWQIGARYADRFAAIAPSAGWSDFWSYMGGDASAPSDPIAALLHRASNGSRTLLWAPNYAKVGVYVLHGDADDNVPVREARRMREELAKFHRDFAYFEQPGAGHWWGNECVDWPQLMAFFQHRTRPDREAATDVVIRLVDLDAERTSGFATLVAQTRPLEVSELRARAFPAERRFEVQTTNVDAFQLHDGVLRHPSIYPRWKEWSGDEAGRAVVDGLELELPLESKQPLGVGWRLRRVDGVWTVDAPESRWEGHKQPDASGPFKQAFDQSFTLVYGTAGSEAENAWSLAKARFDADQFRYRGNGSPLVVSDSEVCAALGDTRQHLSGRNLVLYGNARSNSAWNQLVDSAAFDLQPGRLRVGAHTFEGDDLCVLAVRPNAREPGRLVGLVGGTGLVGMRATNHAPYFVSGAGFPDWWVARSSFLRAGLADHVAAGFFRADWSVDDGADTIVRTADASDASGR